MHLGFFKDVERMRDKGEWGWVRLVGDHITFDKGFDGIAIAPGTRDPPTHTTSTQTPWSYS